MKCPFCGQPLDADAKFCAKCGKKVPRCPTCGTVLYERSRFCINDGTPLPEALFAAFPPAGGAVTAPPPPPRPRPAPPPPRQKSRAPVIAAIVLAVVLLLALAAAGTYYVMHSGLPFFGDRADSFSSEDSRRDDRDDDRDKDDRDKDDRDSQKDDRDDRRDKEGDEDKSGEAPQEPGPADDQVSAADPVSMSVVTSIDASSYLSEPNVNLYHTPERTADGDLLTAWVEGIDGDGLGESITYTFDRTCLVSGMRINAGYQKSDKLYQMNNRPASLTLTFSDGTQQTVFLQDVNARQDIAFSAPVETQSIRLTIASVYAGTTYADTAITELSFY